MNLVNPRPLRSTSTYDSPEHVRVSLAAAMTLGFVDGGFYRKAKLYCLNLLLTYTDGCLGRCAYCGLSQTRKNASSRDQSFIRVDWPIFEVDKIIARLDSPPCRHVERVCVSMITNRRSCDDTLTIVSHLKKKIRSISSLITPTLVNKEWLYKLKEAGADKLGVAVDTSTDRLFKQLRGRGVKGPHKWPKYWRIVQEAVQVFGPYEVGVHLIVGLGETEMEMVTQIQHAHDLGALTHLFSFFPESGSVLSFRPQPPIGSYRRIQLACYLINYCGAQAENMDYNSEGQITGFGINEPEVKRTIELGTPFMTSGCDGEHMANACNRPFSNSTPYQASIGELRNYPFIPNAHDIQIIKRQINDYSDIPVQEW